MFLFTSSIIISQIIIIIFTIIDTLVDIRKKVLKNEIVSFYDTFCDGRFFEDGPPGVIFFAPFISQVTFIMCLGFFCFNKIEYLLDNIKFDKNNKLTRKLLFIPEEKIIPITNNIDTSGALSILLNTGDLSLINLDFEDKYDRRKALINLKHFYVCHNCRHGKNIDVRYFSELF